VKLLPHQRRALYCHSGLPDDLGIQYQSYSKRDVVAADQFLTIWPGLGHTGSEPFDEVHGWYRAFRALAGMLSYTAEYKGWSPFEHRMFPRALRRAVKALLLCQNHERYQAERLRQGQGQGQEQGQAREAEAATATEAAAAIELPAASASASAGSSSVAAMEVTEEQEGPPGAGAGGCGGNKRGYKRMFVGTVERRNNSSAAPNDRNDVVTKKLSAGNKNDDDDEDASDGEAANTHKKKGSSDDSDHSGNYHDVAMEVPQSPCQSLSISRAKTTYNSESSSSTAAAAAAAAVVSTVLIGRLPVFVVYNVMEFMVSTSIAVLRYLFILLNLCSPL
jgi:hypothetical protein